MSGDDERDSAAEPGDATETDAPDTDAGNTDLENADGEISDSEISDVTDTGDVVTRPAPVRRPGVSAASRARRIGGRPAARPGTDGVAATAAGSGAGTTLVDDSVTDAPKKTGASKKESGARDRPSLRKAGAADHARPSRAEREPAGTAPGWLRWLPAAILVTGVIAIAVVLFIASNGVWRGKPSASAQRDQVLAAAKTCVAATASYSYTDLAGFEKRATSCTTGQFTKSFRSSVKDVVDKLAPKTKAVSKAQIDKAGLQSVSDGQWTVVVYGRVTITNTTVPKGRIDPFSAVAIMQKKSGNWVIAKLNLIHQPTS